ncbi:hypothetical protein [Arenimonas composti]|uniref:Uncharacterized protein n=1 Tax=Arenimonas composti TR7-09 = DSM 18010 TaxID=1121013 RepID=A0A091BH89_9GAMM|nr:hypothetical protein [Arenimonas composti]KFN51121.1 hypothetical protein P873_04270 [Arenimonas composti TR7-09 = DSM 18010]
MNAAAETRRGWAVDLGLVLLLALVTTPLAGMVGGFVISSAMLISGIGSAMTVLSFTLLGAIFGALVAWPVTLGVLPAAALLLARLPVGPRLTWLLPLAGLVAGGLRVVEEPAAFAADTTSVTVVLAGALAGLVAGFVFQIALRLRLRA